MAEEKDASTPKRNESARSAADESDNQQPDSVSNDAEGDPSTPPPKRFKLRLAKNKTRQEPTRRESDTAINESLDGTPSRRSVSGPSAVQSTTSPAGQLLGSPNSSSRKRNAKNRSPDQQSPRPKKKRTSESQSHDTEGESQEQSQNRPEIPAVAPAGTPASSLAQNAASTTQNDSKPLSAKQKGKLPQREGDGQPSQIPTPIVPQQSTIRLNAMTPPYTGTASIPGDVSNVLQRIQAQIPLCSSGKPARSWIGGLPTNHIVKGGYISSKSTFYDSWMDTRFFSGPTWWYLATATSKPFPTQYLDRVVPIAPGSIGQALNRSSAWPDTHIYPAPWPTNSSTAPAGPPATPTPQPPQPLVVNDEADESDSPEEQSDQELNESEDTQIRRAKDLSLAEYRHQQVHNGSHANDGGSLASSSRIETPQEDVDVSGGANPPRSASVHWYFNCNPGCGLQGNDIGTTPAIACVECNEWRHTKCLASFEGYPGEEELEQDSYELICPKCKKGGARQTESQPLIGNSTVLTTNSTQSPTDGADSQPQQAETDEEMAKRVQLEMYQNSEEVENPDENPEDLSELETQMGQSMLTSPTGPQRTRRDGTETNVGQGQTTTPIPAFQLPQQSTSGTSASTRDLSDDVLGGFAAESEPQDAVADEDALELEEADF